MYCPTCGAQAQLLSFCKHCGSSLPVDATFDEDAQSEKTIGAVVWVIVGATITILGMCLGALVLMSDKAIDFRLGSFFVILAFAALLLVDGVLFWRLLQLKRGFDDARDFLRTTGGAIDLHSGVRTRALEEPPDSVQGVSESNREFEHSRNEGERR